MADAFSFIQKAVLVAILAWLGIQFGSGDSEPEDKKSPSESVFTTLIR